MDIVATTTEAYSEIIDTLSNTEVQGSRVGGTREEQFVVIRSDNPRDRFVMRPKLNLAFALQECFAYWNGLNPGHVHRYNTKMEDFMTNGVLQGSSYGGRLRATQGDQIQRSLQQLKQNPETRRAVMVIHQPSVEDYSGKDVACTIYLHPMIRNGKLDLIANLRSQDMLWGYPYDVQAFQWMQEVMAGILDVELGRYIHVMNSCHYYTDREEQVLDSTGVKSFELPDCRLDKVGLKDAMALLGTGLQLSRTGRFPKSLINICDALDEHSKYYGDWLRVMAAYELHRFHDKNTDKFTESVTISPWQRWLQERVVATATVD